MSWLTFLQAQPFPRFLSSAFSLLGTATGQFIRVRPEDVPTAEQAHAMKLVYNYKKLLQRRVRLQWTSTNNLTGEVSLAGVRMDLHLVRKLLPAPLAMRFIDLPSPVRRVCTTVQELTVRVGQMVEVGVAVTNCTGVALCNRVFALALEDAESIQGDLIMWSGSLHSLREYLGAGDELSQHFKVCFLAEGDYKFSLECKNDRELNVYSVSPSLVVKVVA